MDSYSEIDMAIRNLKTTVARVKHADQQMDRYPDSKKCQDYYRDSRRRITPAYERVIQTLQDLNLTD